VKPGPLLLPDGSEEYHIQEIVEEKGRGRGQKYRVQWAGWGESDDIWLRRSELIETEALDKWEQAKEGV